MKLSQQEAQERQGMRHTESFTRQVYDRSCTGGGEIAYSIRLTLPFGLCAKVRRWFQECLKAFIGKKLFVQLITVYHLPESGQHSERK